MTGSSATGGDCLKVHVAGALDGPLVVLLEEDGPDETGDGGLVGEDAEDLSAALDLSVDLLERVGGVELEAVQGLGSARPTAVPARGRCA